MTLPEASLSKLQRFAHVGQKRTGDEIVALDWDVAIKGALEHIRDRDTLACAGVEVLDEGHLDVAGQERELDRAQFVEAPAFSAAACRDGLFHTAATFSRSALSLIFIKLGKSPRFPLLCRLFVGLLS